MATPFPTIPVPEPDLGRDLASCAAEVHEHDELGPAAEAAARLTIAALPSAEHAVVTTRAARGLHRVLAGSSELATTLGRLADGPWEGLSTDPGWVRSPHLRADARFPAWGYEAAELGIGSLVCLRLPGRESQPRALTAFSTAPGGFEDTEVATAQLWARHVGTALDRANDLGGLRAALESRHVIGMAQGRLMEAFGLDPDQAFDLLVRTSSVRNLKLREIAEQVVRDSPHLVELATPVFRDQP